MESILDAKNYLLRNPPPPPPPQGLASFFSPPLSELQGKLKNMEMQGSLGKWRCKGA